MIIGFCWNLIRNITGGRGTLSYGCGSVPLFELNNIGHEDKYIKYIIKSDKN